jgi:hypothetical protein
MHVRRIAYSPNTLFVVVDPIGISRLKPCLCEQLLKQPDRYAETTILLEGLVIADHHSVVLFSPMCQEGVYLSHEYGRSGDKWPVFDDALVRKSSGLETAPLRVKVRGIYHPRLKDGEKSIRQLEVIQILAVTLLAK